MNPETKHPYPGYYSAISDIIVKDDYTITFTLKTPTANFLLNLARQGSVIYPREAVDTLKSEPIGTGPFKLAEWVRGDRIVLVKNPDYHVKGLPKLDKVTYRFIPDPNAALAALKAGDIDAAMFGIGPEHVPDLEKDPRFERGPAEPLLHRRVGPHAVRADEGEEARDGRWLPERIRRRAEGRAPV